MKEPMLPEACTIILDDDKGAAGGILASLKSNIHTKVLTFASPKVATRFLNRQRNYEPVLVITDSIGVKPYKSSFLSQVRYYYPRARVILFSGDTLEKEAFKLLNAVDGIDRYIPKESINLLTSASIEFVDDYQRDNVLRSLRAYASECKSPESKFMRIGDKAYSIVDVYREVVCRTKIGKLMEETWLSLTVNACRITIKT